MEKDVEFTIKTFENTLAHVGRRLKAGGVLRERMAEAIRRGDEPDHYRVHWLRASALRVNDTLLQIAIDFNQAHPEDRCSAQDLADILANALTALYHAAGGT